MLGRRRIDGTISISRDRGLEDPAEISRNEYRTRSYATKGIRAGGCNEASRPRKNASLWSRYIAFVEDYMERAR